MSTALERAISVSLLVPMDDPRDPNCRWGLPLMLWGDPGIGKSGRVIQAARAVGLDARVVYPSTHQPEDASGIPLQDGKGGIKTFCMLNGVRELNEKGSGVFFIDELSCARPAVQSAFLNIIYERTWLKPGVRVIGAGNPPESAAGGWALTPPMANRLSHIDVPRPSVDEWTSWVLQGPNLSLDPIENGEKRIRENWQTAFPKWKSLVTGFMRARSGVQIQGEKAQKGPTLFNLPQSGDKSRGKAWPSPRTWEFAYRAAAAVEALGDKTALAALPDLIAGCVGEGQASEWLMWVKKADLPSPEVVLKHGWTPNKDRLDICLAVCSSVVGYALERDNVDERHDYAALAWKFLTNVYNAGLTDIAMSPAQGLMRAGYTHRKSPAMAEACRFLITKLGTSGLANYALK